MNKPVRHASIETELLTQTLASVERIQKFRAEDLPRIEELGKSFAFDDAVPPAKKLIGLFQQIPTSYLHELPDQQLSTLKQQADALFKSLTDILAFDPAKDNAAAQKQNLLSALSSAHQAYFNQLFPIISYLDSRVHDFSALEAEGRAAVQEVRDQAHAISTEMKEHADAAQNTLATIRQIAAEQGVSQHATYFKEEADAHETQADTWRNYTAIGVGTLVVLAAASLYVHNLPGLEPRTVYQTAQIAISKVIVFAIMGYVVVLCARNFLAHRHNAVVNRHRQNALLTFKALVSAAGSEEKQDIVLAHAANCIFSPQDTGYTKGASGGSSSSGATTLLPYVFREAGGS